LEPEDANIHQALIDSPGDPDLLAQGWQKRFTADESRIEEAVSLYEKLGFEICVVAVKTSEMNSICEGCRVFVECNYSTIYTRKHEREVPGSHES